MLADCHGTAMAIGFDQSGMSTVQDGWSLVIAANRILALSVMGLVIMFGSKYLLRKELKTWDMRENAKFASGYCASLLRCLQN